VSVTAFLYSGLRVSLNTTNLERKTLSGGSVIIDGPTAVALNLTPS
jgi:hypothetical protein